MIKNNTFSILLLIILLSSCATYQPKSKGGRNFAEHASSEKIIEQSIYLIGDAGNANLGESTEALEALRNHIKSTNTENNYTVFLGDNIYEEGLPKKSGENRALAEHRINAQIEAVKETNGKVLFIPGNHDWYGDGLNGLERQEKYIKDAIGNKDAFLPKDGCPIEKIDVTDNIVILALDTQWYITNWDRHPTINDECDIKSRNDFFLEIEGILKKNNEKTIIVAMHHPAFTHGPHGGALSFKQHIFPFNNGIPLPFVGSLFAQIRTQGGVSPQDRYNSRYSELMNRLVTMAKSSDRLIFASGHEHSLQFIENEGVKQIVSGSGSKSSAAILGEDGLFAYGGPGFAVLNVFTDGSSEVTYFGSDEGKPKRMFNAQLYNSNKEYSTESLAASFPTTKITSAYKKEATDKGKSYEWFWGDHYRYVYGTDIKTPVATLDTLNGGYTIERKGGGHQTRSLRLIDKNGRNFALRAVKKSAVQFLQTVAFRDTYVKDDFKETLTEDILLDFYTASHPYASFVVPGLSNAIGVYHTNPQLLYIPKHRALGKYNKEFGDELYVIEERPDDDFLDVASFGNPDGIESTADVLKNLRKDEKYRIDEAAYIRARLFDMLLGDWDRHQDQWRWSRFDISDDEKVYRPIPRDRDQVFSNYDGALLDFMKAIIPATRQFQEYKGELKDIKWINSAGIKMDRNFTQGSTKEIWLQEAKFIQENLSDAAIENAFSKLPKEVQDKTSEAIIAKLKERRGHLMDIASRYYDHLAKLIIITATDKDDQIEIIRGDRITTITVSRIKNGKAVEPYRKRVVKSEETKEIWIYALDDDDRIISSGQGSSPVFTRIIGGQNNDSYALDDGRRIKVYDHFSKPNTIVKKGGASFKLNDIYSNNTFDFNKYNNRVNQLLPSIGSNPDDGFKIGIQDTYTIKGFKNNPFHRKHILQAGYYFATQGFDLQYDGEFANLIGNWNLIIGGHFTSDNFAQNFFGFGNETENFEDDFDLDFNRVKTGILKGKVGVVKMGPHGSRVEIGASVERVEVDMTADRFVSILFAGMPEIFDSKIFGGGEFRYSYAGYDNKANPTRGMFFELFTGVKSNLEETERTFGFIKPSIEFYNALTRNRKLVLRTQAQGQFNIGEDYEFYQSAQLGADTGLRGFRKERFSGQSALAFSGDLRYHLLQFKTGLLPLKLGIYGGFDYGRVWIDGEDSDIWHDSVGGGLWINAIDAISGQLGFFNSDEGLRFAFGFGFSL